MSNYINIQVRQRGTKVLTTTDKGIQWGIINNREINHDNEVIYSIKIEGRQNFKKRSGEMIFDTLDELMLYYSKKLKQ